MNLQFTQEELDFQKEVRDWIKDNYPEDMKERLTNAPNGHVTKEEHVQWQQALYAKGWAGINWPKEYGGASFTASQKYLFSKEMAAARAPGFTAFGISMVAPVIMAFGSDEQKSKYLPDILSSKVWWCQGYSEPGSGSDLASLKTKAEDKGDHYLVNGAKTWTTMAQHADMIFCLVRTSQEDIRQKGISFLLIDMHSEGIEVQPIDTLDNTPIGHHEVNTVFFEDVKVPKENLIGEEGKGWTYAKGLLEHERTGLAGLSKSLVELEQLKDKARTVQRGNGNLMDDASYKSKIGELEIDLLATEFTELRSLASAASGGEPGPESSILKLKGTEIKQRIQKLTVEASGIYASAWGDKGVGPSFAKGGTAGYLNSRYFTIYGGASEVQKDIVAKKVLGLTTGKSK